MSVAVPAGYAPHEGEYVLMRSMRIAPAPCFVDLCVERTSHQSKHPLVALPLIGGGGWGKSYRFKRPKIESPRIINAEKF